MACIYGKTGNEEYETFLDKYFEKKYKIVANDGDDGADFEDYCILKHSNKVCVLTLASGHSLLTNRKTITEVDFQITPSTNRMDNKVVGKNRKGAQWLTDLSPICLVRCSENTNYTLRSCLPGKLLEVNEKLREEPTLLSKKPFSDGYLAIILPKAKDWNATSSSFISHEEYMKVLKERELGTSRKSEEHDEVT